jgi:DNA gyrase subunit B
MADKSSYGAESIKVLEGLEGVRKRPSMYIGSTGKPGLHKLVDEIVDNSVDENLAGFCDNIIVTLNNDGSATVEDNGRGIPVEMNQQYKISAVEIALTKLHAGGKFDKDSYKVSGGLHGVGVSVVNALSEKLIIEIKRNGKVYRQEYSRGEAKTKLEIVGKAKDEDDTGTKVTFFPDKEIFSAVDFDYKILEIRFREIAFLNAGVKITLIDEKRNKKETFHYEGGLIEFVKWVNESKEVLHKPIYFKREQDNSIVEIAIQYNSTYQENIFGFVNVINTIEGGTHVSGFKTALTRVINDYGKKTNSLKKDEALTGDDIREGLTAIVSLKSPEPQFEGQTKTKLGNSEIKGFVDSVVTQALGEFFEENPTVAKKIISKALDAAKARLAAKRAKDLVRRKNALSFGGLPGKLADCSRKNSEDTELYIVEGDSAGGCFAGDTKVALADGRNLSFKKLVEEHKQGKQNFCYTIKENGSIGFEKVKSPRVTKRNAEVIKIILDNGKEIICTPDHKFMLRNGNYKEARILKKTDSLMPLHKRISKIGGRITIDGYEMIWDLNKTWIFTHMLADQYNLENGVYPEKQKSHRHHVDFNKKNNNPTNITRLSKEEHLILHSEQISKTLHTELSKRKAAEVHKNPIYRKKISEWAKQPEINKMLSERAKKQWENKDYKDFMMKKYMEFYKNNPEYAELNKKLLDKAQKEYWSNPQNRKKASLKLKKFFSENPDAKNYLSYLAKKQWQNADLIVWRRQKTKEQWTPDFRKKRKETNNKTYYNKTIKLMKTVFEENKDLEKFDQTRIKNNDKTVLSMSTFCNKFFNNNYENMLETIKNYNHKIKKIEWLNKKIDVYDLEVPGTHNFALASGIFVHNSAKQARDKETQAILPLRGKILNVEKASPSKILSVEHITDLITAIGTGVGEQFDASKIRYNKVVIMADADVDGEHIKTLLLTFFYRFMSPLIEKGNIYAAMPPLYRIRKGSKDSYVYSDEELKKVLENLGTNTNVTRFKGLGEMSSEQLWETTMNPKTRKIKKIFVEDAIEADKTFSMLMGDDVQARKAFIMENAKEAELDI